MVQMGKEDSYLRLTNEIKYFNSFKSHIIGNSRKKADLFWNRGHSLVCEIIKIIETF